MKSKSEVVKTALSEPSSAAVNVDPTVIAFCESPFISLSRSATECAHSRLSR